MSVELPADAAAAVRLRDERSGVAVAFALQGASRAAPAVASGYVIYPGAAPSGLSGADPGTPGPAGGDVVHRLHDSGDEDYVYFAREPARKALRYTLDVGLVAGLRLVDDTLELLDAAGAPRVRVAPPVVVDATGRRFRATLRVEGCQVDTIRRAPWGREVTAPGAASCVMVVAWPEEGVRYPALVDPSWQQTSSMITARWGHAVASLASLNGASMPPRLLVTGGFDPTGTLLSATEIYDPLSQTFAVTSPMTIPRAGHTATPIPGSATGQVLLAGTAGQLVAGTVPEHLAVVSSASSSSTEVYDEAGGTFSAGPPMDTPRFFHTSTALVDGRILLAGGTSDTAMAPTNGADIFVPNASSPLGGSIAPALGPMVAARFGHTATVLSSGAVLITGGIDASGAALDSAETFCPMNDCPDPLADDNFYLTSTSMTVARAFHTATGLQTGDVLIAGGASAYAPSATYLATAELFTVGSFQGTSIAMAHARAFHTATSLAPLWVLPDGVGTGLAGVVIMGGFDGTQDLASAEAFFPAAGGSPQAMASVSSAAFSRRHAAASLVSDGSSVSAGDGVLVMGGVSGSNSATGPFTNGSPTSTAELFAKVAGDPCDTDLECPTGSCADGVCCDTACTATCYACNLTGSAGTCSPLPALSQDPGATDPCTGMFTCDGAGDCRVANGGPCGLATDCASDHCSGGLCCVADCTAPQTCGGGGVVGECGCTPMTQCPAGDECGTVPNGCGTSSLSCGTCVAGQTCTANRCSGADAGTDSGVAKDAAADTAGRDSATDSGVAKDASAGSGSADSATDSGVARDASSGSGSGGHDAGASGKDANAGGHDSGASAGGRDAGPAHHDAARDAPEEGDSGAACEQAGGGGCRTTPRRSTSSDAMLWPGVAGICVLLRRRRRSHPRRGSRADLNMR